VITGKRNLNSENSHFGRYIEFIHPIWRCFFFYWIDWRSSCWLAVA